MARKDCPSSIVTSFVILESGNNLPLSAEIPGLRVARERSAFQRGNTVVRLLASLLQRHNLALCRITFLTHDDIPEQLLGLQLHQLLVQSHRQQQGVLLTSIGKQNRYRGCAHTIAWEYSMSSRLGDACCDAQ